MKDKLTYKDFFATVHFSAEDDIFYGKIEGINDLITFEGENVSELRQAFYEAVDDYLQICEANNRSAFKSYKGSLNIRIPVELHRRLSENAIKMGIPINRVIQNAIEQGLHQQNF